VNSEEVFPEEGEVEEVAVTEDIFMPDYDKFKDEDDDAAAGALFAARLRQCECVMGW
jgi:hypothetical protein